MHNITWKNILFNTINNHAAKGEVLMARFTLINASKNKPKELWWETEERGSGTKDPGVA